VDTAPVVTGSALVFHQDIPHEGGPVGPTSQKFIIRTDVMFTRTPPLCDTAPGRAAYAQMCLAEACELSGDAMAAARLYREAARTSPELAQLFGFA